MRLTHWRNSRHKRLQEGFFMSVNRKEAIALIGSLAGQLDRGSPNVGVRLETTDCRYADGKREARSVYFSISAAEDENERMVERQPDWQNLLASALGARRAAKQARPKASGAKRTPERTGRKAATPTSKKK